MKYFLLLLAFFVGGDCTENCGRIYITGTHGNAGDFAKCRTASSLYITGSNLSTLSDFGQLRKISQTEDDGDMPALIISNNKNLIWERGSLSQLEYVTLGTKSLTIPVIAIHDNPKLCIPNADILRLKRAAASLSTDNTFIQECQCDMEVLLEAASTVGHVKNQKVNTPCVTLNGDLVINSSTNEALQSVIMGIRYIHGGISMVDTSWSELRLPSLETIDNVGIEIRNNRNLTKIIIPFLRAILSTGKHANIIDNLKLRIDYALEERLLLTRMRKGSEENRLEIKTSPCVINETESLISLASCRNVVGDIIITAANSEISILENLAFVEVLRGCLTISGTKLQNLSFLRNLKEVHCEKDRPPILIEDNKQLVDIDLGIHRVRSTLRKPLEIKGNDMLCRDYIKRWQNVLRISRAKDQVHEIDMRSVSERCDGVFVSDSHNIMVPVTILICVLVLIYCILIINRSTAKQNKRFNAKLS
ncbi:hypothetical protein RB195_012868 [Necator americanus]|uniref:Receptor L-domain domain-containing protein n=1 Tax=Necator americanus TaxID=51031 RepID=A0ABR1DSY4_NECAM